MRTPATGIVDLTFEFGEQSRVIPTLLIKASRPQFIAGMSFCRAFDVALRVDPGFYNKHPNKIQSRDVLATSVALVPDHTIPCDKPTYVCPIHDSNPYKDLSPLIEMDPNVQREKRAYLDQNECVCNPPNSANSNSSHRDTAAEASIENSTSTWEIGSGKSSPLISEKIQLPELNPLTNASPTKVKSKLSVCDLGIDSQATDSSAAALSGIDVTAIEIELGNNCDAVELLSLTQPAGKPNQKPIKYVDPTPTLQRLWSEHNSFRFTVNTDQKETFETGTYESAPICDLMEIVLGPRTKPKRDKHPGKSRRERLRTEKFEIMALKCHTSQTRSIPAFTLCVGRGTCGNL
ncbi:uncharacterized protein LOC129571343 [Sitodiplosis mosellana]|uniref:uncharacterized protein LOC129571343 n=1 Tax=Sitodiplosis mosellana TaxID=263140 RepID=UPI00244421A8|nr:uncharacterized protein LOC129571343 [Sitodiplosis mosellana]